MSDNRVPGDRIPGQAESTAAARARVAADRKRGLAPEPWIIALSEEKYELAGELREKAFGKPARKTARTAR